MESPANTSNLLPVPQDKGGFTFDSVFSIYCRCLGVILLVAAILKAISSFGTARILQMPDPIFGLSSRWVFLITATIEVVIGLLAVSQWRSARTKSILLTWLGACFACYHAGLMLGGVKVPCPCFGRAIEWLPWLAGRSVVLTEIITMLLCLTGVIYFLRFLRQGEYLK